MNSKPDSVAPECVICEALGKIGLSGMCSKCAAAFTEQKIALADSFMKDVCETSAPVSSSQPSDEEFVRQAWNEVKIYEGGDGCHIEITNVNHPHFYGIYILESLGRGKEHQ